ncbi:MAG: DUF4292 domain-containing protein [Bacteroidaceae bacterium]
MNLKKLAYLLLLLTPLVFSSCRTSKNLTKEKKEQLNTSDLLKEKVITNSTKAECVTASASVDLRFGDKNFTVGGSLKMKRNDVIQLSLRFLGFEVGRMEFTTNEVLVIDRVNKQYVRVPYNKVSFLNDANLDFNALQSLFWGELFVPGQQNVASQLVHFTQGESGNYTMLSLSNQPKLEYNFLIEKNACLINRVTIESKNPMDATQFVWLYGKYQSLQGGKFPQSMNISMKGIGKDNGIGLSLSNINTNSSWEMRTEVPSKYKQQSVEAVMRRLMSLGQ